MCICRVDSSRCKGNLNERHDRQCIEACTYTGRTPNASIMDSGEFIVRVVLLDGDMCILMPRRIAGMTICDAGGQILRLMPRSAALSLSLCCIYCTGALLLLFVGVSVWVLRSFYASDLNFRHARVRWSTRCVCSQTFRLRHALRFRRKSHQYSSMMAIN